MPSKNDQISLSETQYFGGRRCGFNAVVKFSDPGHYVNVTADYVESDYGVEKGLYFADDGEALGYAIRKRLDWVLAMRAKFGA